MKWNGIAKMFDRKYNFLYERRFAFEQISFRLENEFISSKSY